MAGSETSSARCGVQPATTRVAWFTDLHLNFLDQAQRQRFFADVRSLQADLALIGGDIAEAADLPDFLEQLPGEFGCPVAFVLGNHDFYYSSIRRVRAQVQAVCDRVEGLTYLTVGEALELTPRVGLIGHDGWSDARAGDYASSEVMLSDYGLIAELAGLSKEARRRMLNALGDEAAWHVRQVLPGTAERYEQVLLLTHVPPLREACWHQGRVSDDEWAPHFTCLAMGQAILEVMADFPRTRLTVLCGHTHGEGETVPLPNVRILTGGAEYGHPRVSRVFDLD